MRRATAILPLLLLLLLLVPACITDPVTGETVLGMPASDQEEVAMGAEYAPSFKAQYEGRYPDAELQRHCEEIVLGMAHHSHRPDLPWHFTILNSSEVNAFALPGGEVCITRGLLHRLDTEAEFAGVMGHEIGHVTHKHAMQGMARSQLLGVLVAGAAVGAEQSGSDLAMLGVQLGAMGGQLLLLKYSRGQESQADQRGVEYSYRAGYDPREMAKVFTIFKEMKGGESPPVLFSSHPLDDDRIKAVKREVRKVYPEVKASKGEGLVRTTPTWDRLIAKLRRDQAVYDDYDAAGKAFAKAAKAGDRAGMRSVLETLESCARRLPGHALFPSGIGVVLDELGEKDEAKSWFERAEAMQDDLFEPHLYLAAIAAGRNDTATTIREASRARELFPHHPTPPYLLARGYDQSGDTKQAVKGYKAVMELAPAESEEYRFSVKRLTELGEIKPKAER